MPKFEYEDPEGWPERHLVMYPDSLPNTDRTRETADAGWLFHSAAANAERAGFPDAAETCRIMGYFAEEKAGRDHDFGSNMSSDYGESQISFRQGHVRKAMLGILEVLSQDPDGPRRSKVLYDDHNIRPEFNDIFALAGIPDPAGVSRSPGRIEFQTNLGINLVVQTKDREDFGQKWTETTVLAVRAKVPQASNA